MLGLMQNLPGARGFRQTLSDSKKLASGDPRLLLEAAALTAQTLQDDDMGNWAPGLSLLSMRHEVQYSRLYRS